MPDRVVQVVSDAHARPKEAVLDALGVALEAGLAAPEVRRRRQAHGANRLRQHRRRSAWAILAGQFRSIIVYLLAGAAVLSLSFGEWTDSGAILAVLAINTAIGFATEFRAVRSMEALRRLSKVAAKVRRDGQTRDIPAEEIVPGDIVLLASGDIVPADLRLADIANLQCDESALTGESAPVSKSTEPCDRQVPLAERSCMAFKGTAVTRGSAVGVAVATGMQTELGTIAALADDAEPEVSPLQKRLDHLGRQLVWGTLALTAVIAAMGVLAGHDLLAMIKTAVALAVAAVPEGIPIVATVALARGMWRMARRNALIENLAAVETLGATTVILTDKTGTLTENRMTVVRIRLAEADIRIEPGDGRNAARFMAGGHPVELSRQDALRDALRVAVLCNNASITAETVADGQRGGDGDPMEVALLVAARAAGLDDRQLRQSPHRAREEAFSAETKMMATFQEQGDGYLVAVKGAPEAVVACCTRVRSAEGARRLDGAGREAWLDANAELTAQGLRVLGLAMGHVGSTAAAPYEDLTLIGLVGLLDPPRPDVGAAIAACHDAGLRVVMLTGDQAGTARTIAAEVGVAGRDAEAMEATELGDFATMAEEERRRLLRVPIFARVSPRTKLDLVSLYQEAGEVVAMTGDGVNDAPALKKADIGIAMGKRGTDVAREAADMVLRDDAFPSIVAAIHQGRVIFDNIRKFVVYLMSCNLSEIMVIGVATASGLPLPLLPLQILYLNLVTDVFPAFALGIGEGDPRAMRKPPRDPGEPVLSAAAWISIGVHGGLIAAATLGAFVAAQSWLALSPDAALTVSFLTLALAQLWHVFNMRAPGSGALRNDVTRNPFVWAALALCLMLLAAAIFVPALSGLLGITPPGADAWMLILGASLAPLLLGQVLKAVMPHIGGDARR